LEQKTVTVAPGDFLVLYTDGVTEALNSAGEMFGEDLLSATLNAHRDGSAEEVRDGLLRVLFDFIQDTPQADDITLVIAKRVSHE
jgi:sigma-B regulation protein RsbU (phosphoserine phosphatase)